jgi:hypothetical protein
MFRGCKLVKGPNSGVNALWRELLKLGLKPTRDSKREHRGTYTPCRNHNYIQMSLRAVNYREFTLSQLGELGQVGLLGLVQEYPCTCETVF